MITLINTAEFKNKAMPYLGIGSISRFGSSNWGYMWQVGVMFTGGIKSTVTGSTNDPADVEFAETLATEKEDFEDSIPKIKVLPLVKLGLTYSF